MLQADQRLRLLHHYFFVSYLVVVGLSLGFINGVALHDLQTGFFVIATLLSSSFFYLLPALVLSKSVHFLLAVPLGRVLESRKTLAAVLDLGVAMGAVALVELLVLADRSVFSLFGFHINGFVVNLVTTPGGMESMGAGGSAILIGGVGILALGLAQALVLWLLYKARLTAKQRSFSLPGRLYRYGLMVIVLLGVSEKATYGMSHLQDFKGVLVAAHAFPLYQPLTIRSLAEKLGVEVKRQEGLEFDNDISQLSYPAQPLQVTVPAKPLNIVWLVAESWRADMLDPEIMPETWKFSRQGQRFTNHFSGGNGTRMGLFSMFYGVYGPYWFSFLGERRQPVMMDVLQDQGYQFGLYTSAKFSYPEFDKTIFAGMPEALLHSHQESVGWKADRHNVGEMLNFMKKRDAARPFMSFMFFESPHASYYFPEESVIRRPYLEDFNYATMSLDKDIALIRNRYINSCHHLDSQFARVFAYLEENDLLDTTIVIITGDHGEEFMERGRWGHNSDFNKEQVQVPLVIRLPGKAGTETNRMTSHLDIPPTLLPLLGVTNDSSDYAQGFDLFGPIERKFTLIADWSRVCYVDGEYKAVIPLKTSGVLNSKTTTSDDEPLADSALFYKTHMNSLQEVLKGLGKFKRGSAS
ncbi:MAG: sulfatase-like hydrolase/transferase [Proteobacteria bacterium]|nr:sulfatase-like hydrolase/transferase [Pseudomonadota bacterium]MBU1641205.1 sulfatase-like hydrolase/transferase [Pseudomonadota bacterium]